MNGGGEVRVEGVVGDNSDDDDGEPVRKPNPESKKYLMKKLGMIPHTHTYTLSLLRLRLAATLIMG